MNEALACLAAYLIGAIPFGVFVARGKGVNIFAEGSGNCGATNVGRVLGKPYGILVFVLDFLKGAIPAALAVYWRGSADWIAVAIGLLAVIGHMFPVYLGFRGGKGVATGAGVDSMSGDFGGSWPRPGRREPVRPSRNCRGAARDDADIEAVLRFTSANI